MKGSRKTGKSISKQFLSSGIAEPAIRDIFVSNSKVPWKILGFLGVSLRLLGQNNVKWCDQIMHER